MSNINSTMVAHSIINGKLKSFAEMIREAGLDPENVWRKLGIESNWRDKLPKEGDKKNV
jgi:capsid protein